MVSARWRVCHERVLRVLLSRLHIYRFYFSGRFLLTGRKNLQVLPAGKRLHICRFRAHITRFFRPFCLLGFINWMIIVAMNGDMRRKRKFRRLMAAWWFLGRIRKRRQNRRFWVKPWLSRRENLGAFETLVSELRQEDEPSFLNFLRLSPGIYDDLLATISPYIERQNTRFRKPIPPGPPFRQRSFLPKQTSSTYELWDCQDHLYHC